MIKGSCTCGDVEFHISGELTDVSFCHCSICRKVSGSAFASYGSTPIGKFEWGNLLNSLCLRSQLTLNGC
jgi:hypothetical protein